ncbi:MAG TPA: hypothetical protein PKE12_06560 [Kiritimatiellia bacterium]|nr:hypothetical protein [Kiritimatiellia bacterium]
MKRTTGISLLLFLAVLAGAEWAARRELPVVPTSEAVSRNPHRYRGWPEFTTLGPASAGVARVVLLSNSQAYAGEIPANRIYADKLERALTAQRAGGFERVEVLNWSFDGVTSIELTLLATRLREAAPELVIAALGVADFSGFNLDRPMSQCRTDLPRLATRPEIWSALPEAYTTRHVKLEDWLTYAAWDRAALLRFRDFGWSWLDQQWGGLLIGLYAPALNYHPWRLEHLKKRGSFGGPPWRKPTGRLEVIYPPEARVLLDEFLDAFRAIPAKRHLVIATPHHVEPDDSLFAPNRAFLADFAAAAAERGLDFRDDSALYPAAAFFDGLHFRGDYHQYYCEHLIDVVTPLLAH